MIYRPARHAGAAILAVSLLALPFAAPAGARLAAPAAHADGVTQLAEGGRQHTLMRGRACRFRGARLSLRELRWHARRAGYRRIHDIRFVPRRHGRYNWCGFYRAEAMQRGRPFVIFADAHSGRIIDRRRIGRRGQSYRQNLSNGQVRRILRRQGYRQIRNLRYVRRNGRDFYVARAQWRRWVVRVRVDDETGRIVNQRRLRRLSLEMKRPDLSEREVRALLRSRGYSKIRDVRYEQIAEAPKYVATASYDRVAYRVQVSGTTGKVEAKRRLR